MVDTMRGFGKITKYIIMQTLGRVKESGTEREVGERHQW